MSFFVSLKKININIPEEVQDLRPLIFYDWPIN